MRLYLNVLLVVLLFSTDASLAKNFVTTDPCPEVKENDFETISAKLECMESRFDELQELQSVLLSALLKVEERLDVQSKKQELDQFGPVKGLEVIKAESLAVTTSFWSGGNRHKVWNCVPPLTKKENKTLIGGKLGTSIRKGKTRNGTCAQSPHCDSAGEFCEVQSRNAGCYVNTSWYDWYKSNQKKRGLPAIPDMKLCEE